MRAVAIRPGSAEREPEMIEVPRPAAGPGEVLIAMRDVGIDGTDFEVMRAEHGETPRGSDYIVMGHESLGQVAEVGAGVEGLAPGDWVVATVRRPDGCPNCRRGESDMCLWGDYTERGIKGAHGYLAEYAVDRPEFIVPLPARLRPVGALVEPLSINEKAIGQAWTIQRRMHWEPRVALILGLGTIGILAAMILRRRGLETYIYSRAPAGAPTPRLIEELGVTYISAKDVEAVRDLARRIGRIDFILEATGAAEVAAQSIELVQPNAALCLLSVTGGHARQEVDVAALNQRLVMGNGLIFGSVNSSAAHFREAIRELDGFEQAWPGFTERLISRRVPFDDFRLAFEERDDDIKVLIEVSGG